MLRLFSIKETSASSSSPVGSMERLSCAAIGLAVLAMTRAEVVDPSMVGWRMIDRFAGFRFEVSGDVMGTGFHSAAVAKADELGCFGWIQDSEAMTVVGEARCAKTLAPQMKEFLYTGGVKSTVDDVHVYDYPDTKIKLHFSHFKSLPEDRITCFHDPPHQCKPVISKEEWDNHRHGGDEL